MQMTPPADATDVLHHGKYDSITQTTPFPRGYFQRGLLEQEVGDVNVKY